jgi:hypothetical protein
LAKSLDGFCIAIIAENLRMLGEKGEILLQGGRNGLAMPRASLYTLG